MTIASTIKNMLAFRKETAGKDVDPVVADALAKGLSTGAIADPATALKSVGINPKLTPTGRRFEQFDPTAALADFNAQLGSVETPEHRGIVTAMASRVVLGSMTPAAGAQIAKATADWFGDELSADIGTADSGASSTSSGIGGLPSLAEQMALQHTYTTAQIAANPLLTRLANAGKLKATDQ